MDVIAALSVSKSILDLGKEIAKVVKKAQNSPDVTRRVLLYLKAAQAAVSALGLERQYILTDVRKCDIDDPDQVTALWIRLDRYLHEDNIRDPLNRSIIGLGKCRKTIEKEAKASWWRKRDKEAAAKAFSSTLNKLEFTLQNLTSNFYPGGSGMGVLTLVPIFELISRVRDNNRRRYSLDSESELPRRKRQSIKSQSKKTAQPTAGKVPREIQAINERLGELAVKALHDSSHEAWFRTTGEVEALIAELQLAFSITVTEK